MYALSAADAISPALQRTRTFLFAPFRWGTFLKLCIVALLTEGLSGNFQSSFRHERSTRHIHDGNAAPAVVPPFHLTAEQIAAIVALSLAAILIGCVVFYLITRLRFAYFHCLIHNTREITPGWRLYRTQATRFFWMNLAVAFCFVLLMAVIAILFGAGIWRVVQAGQATGHLDLGLLLSLVLPLIPIIFLFVLTAIAADLILRDFMLPHYALDNTTAGEAWRRVSAGIRFEKTAFFGYALLRVILPLIAIIAIVVVLMLPALISVATVALVEFGIHAAFVHATGAGVVVGIVLQFVIGVAAFAVALLMAICLGGPLSTAVREYALLFYGGRYPRLGDILFPPPAVLPNTPGIA